MADNTLELKEIGKISGTFIVEGYQRGYRWGSDEVTRLLDDIYTAVALNDSKTYCLQPIVVKCMPDGFELIDGQQRLTTIYLIYKYIASVTTARLAPKFSLDYITRPGSRDYLEKLDPARSAECIDFYYMFGAYKSIEKWFDEVSEGDENKRFDLATEMNKAFLHSVKVIWYEVGDGEVSEKLFARLNIGKIPLTCAELVKAMFLSKSSGACGANNMNEIALQWDMTERELHSDSLWYFLTNSDGERYSTRIELVLDLMAKKPSDCRERYFTFFYFDKLARGNGENKPNFDAIWSEINRAFLLLKSWHDDDELYHKIGYLIASEHSTLSDIYALSLGKSKSAFKSALEGEIRDSVKAKKNYGAMSYENAKDYGAISRLLLLFNVISVYELGDGNRFPFDRYKNTDGAKWSLEHIHAQNSEGLKTVKQWQEWIGYHIDCVKEIKPDADGLIQRMTAAKDNINLLGSEFDAIYSEVMSILSPSSAMYDKHRISNLALLDTSDNSALGNSAFAAKRRKIIEMDRKGEYIPFCTKMVFFKYYSSNAGSLYFWSEKDREQYVKALNDKLDKYLEETIEIAEEDD